MCNETISTSLKGLVAERNKLVFKQQLRNTAEETLDLSDYGTKFNNSLGRIEYVLSLLLLWKVTLLLFFFEVITTLQERYLVKF